MHKNAKHLNRKKDRGGWVPSQDFLENESYLMELVASKKVFITNEQPALNSARIVSLGSGKKSSN